MTKMTFQQSGENWPKFYCDYELVADMEYLGDSLMYEAAGWKSLTLLELQAAERLQGILSEAIRKSKALG